jgi:small subunit ribosomal protein S21
LIVSSVSPRAISRRLGRRALELFAQLDILRLATQSFLPHFFDATSAPQFAATGGAISLSEVIIHDDENFERALKRFKKKCEKAGILSDLRKHRHYEKPSERRKRKMNAAIRKNRRTRTA